MGIEARKPDFVAYEQQRCRLASRSAQLQSEQHICYSLSKTYNSLACYVPTFNSQLVSVSEYTDLSLTWLEPLKTEFLPMRPKKLGGGKNKPQMILFNPLLHNNAF